MIYWYDDGGDGGFGEIGGEVKREGGAHVHVWQLEV